MAFAFHIILHQPEANLGDGDRPTLQSSCCTLAIVAPHELRWLQGIQALSEHTVKHYDRVRYRSIGFRQFQKGCALATCGMAGAATAFALFLFGAIGSIWHVSALAASLIAMLAGALWVFRSARVTAVPGRVVGASNDLESHGQAGGSRFISIAYGLATLGLLALTTCCFAALSLLLFMDRDSAVSLFPHFIRSNAAVLALCVAFFWLTWLVWSRRMAMKRHALASYRRGRLLYLAADSCVISFAAIFVIVFVFSALGSLGSVFPNIVSLASLALLCAIGVWLAQTFELAGRHL